MMAQVSELSMNQAEAMRLQSEVKEREAELEQVGLWLQEILFC